MTDAQFGYYGNALAFFGLVALMILYIVPMIGVIIYIARGKF